MKKEINFFRFARCASLICSRSFDHAPYIDVVSHVAVVVVAFLCKWLNLKHEILHFTARCPCRIRNFSSHDEDTRLKRTIHWKHLKSLLYHWQTHWQPDESRRYSSVSLPTPLSLSLCLTHYHHRLLSARRRHHHNHYRCLHFYEVSFLYNICAYKADA